MAKKKDNNKLFLVLACLSSFILGGVILYLIISKTNIIPINYQSKYFQIYDANKTPTTEVYIDLARGFTFNYSPVYNLTSETPSSLNTKSADYFRLELARGKSKISINGYVPNEYGPMNTFNSEKAPSTLMEYVKSRTASIFEPITKARKFTPVTISGKEGVIYEFEMTEEIYDAIPNTVFGKGTMQPNKIKEEQKPGYKVKVVYFKNGNFVYTIGTDSLGDPSQIRAFDSVINSFKFLF